MTSSTSSPATTSGAGGAGGSFEPPPGALTVSFGPFTVPAGTERTQCVTKRLGNATAIHVGQIHNELIGVSHHLIVYRVGDAVEKLDPQDCQPFADTLDPNKGVPLMITQSKNETLDLPKGVGFDLDANQMIRLEVHFINPNADDRTIEGHSTFVPMPDGEFQNEAGFVFAGDTLIVLPPNQKTTINRFISMPPDLVGKSFFGFTGHEHQMGTNVRVGMGNGVGPAVPVYDVPNFTWSEPPTVYHDPPIVLPDGNGFSITCDYENTSSNQITFGETANDEMCFFWSYYYPNVGAKVIF